MNFERNREPQVTTHSAVRDLRQMTHCYRSVLERVLCFARRLSLKNEGFPSLRPQWTPLRLGSFP